MVETYNLKNTNTGKYKSIKNPVARGKAGMFCRTRKQAFNGLQLKNQSQNVKNQWNKVRKAVNDDCERIIKFTNGNGKYTNDFNLGYVLNIQNSIRLFDENLKAQTKKNIPNKKTVTNQINEDPQPPSNGFWARSRKQKQK